MPDPTPRPWWASFLTSVVATILGAAIVFVAVCLLRPALAPGGDVYWGGLFALGLGLATTGASLLGRGSEPPDQRGQIDVQALGAVAGLAFAVVLLLVAALSAPGCAGSVYQAQRRADVDWTPGPPCHIEVHLDGEKKAAVTVDAPTACEPPPTKCPAVGP